MFAPAALRCRVTASLSSSVIASTGAGSRAEPPPESRQRHKSSAASDSTRRRISAAPAAPAAVGSFTPAGRAACRRIRVKGRRQSAGTLIQPASCFSSASRGPRTSSTAADMPAPALPAPTTMIRRRRDRGISSSPITKSGPSTCSTSRTRRSERTAASPACQMARASSSRLRIVGGIMALQQRSSGQKHKATAHLRRKRRKRRRYIFCHQDRSEIRTAAPTAETERTLRDSGLLDWENHTRTYFTRHSAFWQYAAFCAHIVIRRFGRCGTLLLILR